MRALCVLNVLYACLAPSWSLFDHILFNINSALLMNGCPCSCIKPNDDKKPRHYNRPRVAQQLTYTGVLETTRIRRDGYALRLDHVEFLNRCAEWLEIWLAR